MEIIFAFFLGIVMLCGMVLFGAALYAFPIKWLWNYAAVDMFGLHEINFWHAWALGALCGLLFKSKVSSNEQENTKNAK
jgi:hypothetical protein